MIELKGVTKNFDNFKVLENIDLTIPKGSAFGLLGSNGAGKSTILRLLSGIYKAEGGNVLIDGEEVYDNIPIKQKVFFINDETIQFSNFTLNELKNFYKGFYPNFSQELFEKLRNSINLPLNKKLSQFSKGMKRQAIVITALACQTDYLLLDEAFDGLDPTMRIIVKRMIVDAIIDRDLTTIISSHNLKEINEVCDTVALLHEGKIIFSKDLDSVKGNIHKIQTAFPEAYTAEDFSELQIMHFEKNQSIYYMIIKGDEDEIRKQLAPKNPLILDVIPLSLEEIFIYELGGENYEVKDILF